MAYGIPTMEAPERLAAMLERFIRLGRTGRPSRTPNAFVVRRRRRTT